MPDVEKVEDTKNKDDEKGVDVVIEQEKDTTVYKSKDGGKIDPKDTSPPEDSPRWNEIYKKAKDGERALEKIIQLEEKINKDGSLMGEMREHNKKLADSIEKMSSATVSAIESKSKVDEVAILGSTITKLKEIRKVATKDMDYDKVDTLTDDIYEAKVKLKELTTKPVKEKKDKVDVEPSKENAEYKKFITNTPWMSEDPIMRAAAVEVDSILSNDPNWSTKSDVDRLKEVKERIEKRFNYTTDKTNTQNIDGGVEAASKVSAGGGSGKTVKLSPVEMNIIKGLNITAEDYAKQKVAMGGE